MFRATSLNFSFAVLAMAMAGCSTPAKPGAPSSQLQLFGGSGSEGKSEKPAFVRPALVGHSGDYFRWVMPKDWRANETSNGVDLTSPDGSMAASSAVLMGSRGKTDPWSFLNWALAAAGNRNVERIGAENLPPQPSGYPGISYEVKAFTIRFMDKDGVDRRAECTVGICNAYGSFSAAFQLYSTSSEKFEEGKTWLPILTDSVKPIDASRMGNQNTVLLARNHPFDDSTIMSSWQVRRDSQDRIDQQQHETTMGYERMVSPVDGTHYNMPFESYDGTMGGYRDPADGSQVLQHAPPGE